MECFINIMFVLQLSETEQKFYEWSSEDLAETFWLFFVYSSGWKNYKEAILSSYQFLFPLWLSTTKYIKIWHFHTMKSVQLRVVDNVVNWNVNKIQGEMLVFLIRIVPCSIQFSCIALVFSASLRAAGERPDIDVQTFFLNLPWLFYCGRFSQRL